MKNYIDGVKPLDINRVEVTAQVRDVLCELLRDMSVRLGYSKSSDWGGMQRPSYAGAWVCRVLMPSGEIEDLTKIHGRTIKHLFDCGVISVDDTISQRKRVLFKLSSDAMKNIREVRRILEFPARTKVRWQPLNDMAAMYGVKIEYESHRGLIRLLTLEGKSFREDELVTRNKAGEPVMKINDLTWHEWTELLAECADMIAEMR